MGKKLRLGVPFRRVNGAVYLVNPLTGEEQYSPELSDRLSEVDDLELSREVGRS